MPPLHGSTYVPQPVVDGCAKCRPKGRHVPVADCEACTRGFLVRYGGEPAYVLCPAELTAGVVADIMSKRVIATRPDLPIESLILLLVDEAIAAVPVVDAEHRPIGMASKSDLVFDDYEWAELRDEAVCLRRIARFPGAPDETDDVHLTELLRSKTVRDIMSGDPLTVTPATRIVDAARLMATRHVHGCPVVDADGRLVAMVTATDVARWVGAQG
jgi:CBS-domain-containing membrane protein